MKIQEMNGDLFTAPADFCLVHCISGDYALGKGIAVTFADRYEMREKLHRQYPIPEGQKFANVGKALFIDNVFNLVTKQRYYHKPTYDDLYDTLVDMREQCVNQGITKVAMPTIGCGLDRLQWTEVRKILEDVFADTEIEMTVYRNVVLPQ